MTKVVIVVQARMSSTRLPGKVLLPILGETLLKRMIERLQMIKHEATIVIATSDSEQDDILQTEADKIGVPCFRGSLDNCLDRHYQAGLKYGADVVIKIPSDCPLIDPRIIDDVLDFYFAHKGEYDFVNNLHPATWPDGNDVEIMTMACIEKAWKEASRKLELEHTTPYIWENPGKFRIANIEWSAGKDYSMSHRFTIDYPEDYDFIKLVYEELYPAKADFSCDDILSLLESKPEIYEINSGYAGVNWYRNHLDELKTVGAGQTKTLSNKQV
ncbi:glycosyltransferase family protein [Mucilaginibacter sp. HMF5004]|uniref:cytidylyltransferase domain-containing protein n=1 Tax=Mucilaginibacter rivuli TaxID=2857527 RepID=UPI001C5FED57|nr:glycosyltransferase family protein [Mucilaginibacter rivuli]MBW4889285.1 glycosyltransferase family protein [Mucilaginibacter rivuli]